MGIRINLQGIKEQQNNWSNGEDNNKDIKDKAT